jgi:Zinc knuckle/SCAN domain
MTEDEDLTYYLELFETTAIAGDISKEKWSLHLTHKLNTKLRDFMIQMKYINNSDYDFVKNELLKQTQHTEEACRTRWHDLKPKSDDLKTFYVALQRHFDNWLRTSRTPSTVEGITDLILKDRILSVLSDAALSDVVLRQPGTSIQALEYIDQYRDATKGSINIIKRSNTISYSEPPYIVSAANNFIPRRRSNSFDQQGCYKCGRKGHFANQCFARQNSVNSDKRETIGQDNHKQRQNNYKRRNRSLSPRSERT